MLSCVFIVTFLCVTIYFINSVISGIRFSRVRTRYDYDAIIVGGSITGPAIAKVLSDQGRSVLLVERVLFTKPNRIVGELLQPGGIEVLRSLGMERCATSIGMPCKGYFVMDHNGNSIDLPYREGAMGVSFHFGDFVQNLREFVYHNCKENVKMVEGTVTQILTEGFPGFERAYGVEYSVVAGYREPENPFQEDPPQQEETSRVKRTATAPLVIMCDGGASKWKGCYQHYTPATDCNSNFVGVILKAVSLPLEQRGTVFFSKTGPILLYRLDDNQLRVLVDYKGSQMPSLGEQSEWLAKEIASFLPENIRTEFLRVVSNPKNLRSMPTTRYPQTFPCIKGYVGLGDHNNQRHPLTGGGMTCAFRDAVCLATNLKGIPHMRAEYLSQTVAIHNRIHEAIMNYSRHRYLHSCCMNILSWALYDVFSIPLLREACMDYFSYSGDCMSVPMDLLSGLELNVLVLFYHFYRVIFRSVLKLVLKRGPYKEQAARSFSLAEKCWNGLTFFVDFTRMYAAAYLLVRSTLVMLPLLRNEFFSVWRLIDPTSVMAIICKRLQSFLFIL